MDGQINEKIDRYKDILYVTSKYIYNNNSVK